ncbi:hypothetical protein BDY24DRAFT_286796 [Mrakia frigida]|uniref:uncharacterized protein n=1 Tax=Mrakia frigida TaxID=29902 RepID=UPI003FCC1423
MTSRRRLPLSEPPRLLYRSMSTRRSFPPAAAPNPSSSSSPPTERVIPRLPLLSFLPPPPRSSSLSLPLPPVPDISPIPGYTHTTHFLPSAYPRTFYDSTSPPASKPASEIWKPVDPISSGESRAERMKRVNKEIDELTSANEDGKARLVQEGERVGVRLEQVVERFVKERRNLKGGEKKKEVTLILVSFSLVFDLFFWEEHALIFHVFFVVRRATRTDYQ